MADIFLDNFTGSGTLNAHTSDSGHTYATSGGDNPVNLQLNAGLLENYNLNFGGGKTTLVLPATFSLVITAVLGTQASSGSGALVTQYLQLAGSPSSTPGFQMDAGDIYFDCGTALSGNSGSVAHPANGTHTFQFDVTPTTRAWLLDGVPIASVSGAPPSLAGRDFGFELYVDTADYGAYKIDSLRIYTSAPPPPPPAFWTASVGATETA